MSPWRIGVRSRVVRCQAPGQLSKLPTCRLRAPALAILSRSSVQHINLSKAGDRATVADSAHLRGFALAVAERAAQLIRRLPAQGVACSPEIRCARLISNVAQHAGDLPLLDFPEGLPAKLEVVTLLVDRIATATVNQDPVVNVGCDVLQRDAILRRLQRDVRHPWKGDVTPALGV